jgi:hypothetical protein
MHNLVDPRRLFATSYEYINQTSLHPALEIVPPRMHGKFVSFASWVDDRILARVIFTTFVDSVVNIALHRLYHADLHLK